MFRRKKNKPGRDQSRAVVATKLNPAGGFVVAAVGESHYQRALWAATGATRNRKIEEHVVRAVLVPDYGNEHDPNAVAVHIDDIGQVGYLSRKEAAEYRPLLEALPNAGVSTCEAAIWGGGFDEDGRPRQLGIWLDLARPWLGERLID